MDGYDCSDVTLAADDRQVLHDVIWFLRHISHFSGIFSNSIRFLNGLDAVGFTYELFSILIDKS